jgi:hypothetical protein
MEINKVEEKKKQFQSANWEQQKEKWPKMGRHILAQYDEESIVVYQAYNPQIAEFAVQNKKFIGAPGFSETRMTWIKTNFLWMMYRAGWAEKHNQERILAIWLTRTGFETILQRAAVVNRDFGYYKNAKEALRALSKTSVRLQWDPDHTPSGTNLTRRAVQLGLRHVREYINGQWIVDIQDITPFVKQNFGYFKGKIFDKFETAKEEIYIPSSEELCKHIALSKVGVPDNDVKMNYFTAEEEVKEEISNNNNVEEGDDSASNEEEDK